jgi:endonuclease/exonuclease/phosphatase family metal-dependent hydrolase
MQRRSTLALTLALAGGGLTALLTSAADATPRQVNLRVMTFNVRFDFPNDGRNRWNNRRDLVAQTILGSQAQLVCIQEDKEDQVADLEERMEGFSFVGVGRNATGSGERNSIAYSDEHLQLIESGDFWLSDTPLEPGSNTWGDRYPRKATWAVLETRTRSEKRLLVLNTHLPEGDDDSLRRRGVEVIRDWLQNALSGRSARDVTAIVCGDWNDDEESHCRRMLTEEWDLRDTWAEADPDDRWPGTYNAFRGATTRQRIDWILVRGPVATLAADKLEDNDNGRYPSDHYPVIADLQIR